MEVLVLSFCFISIIPRIHLKGASYLGCAVSCFLRGRSFVGKNCRSVDLSGNGHSLCSYMGFIDGSFWFSVAIVWSFLRYLLTGRGKYSEISVVNELEGTFWVIVRLFAVSGIACCFIFMILHSFSETSLSLCQTWWEPKLSGHRAYTAYDLLAIEMKIQQNASSTEEGWGPYLCVKESFGESLEILE